MRTCVNCPTGPARLTATPGTSRKISDTITVWRSWRSIGSKTVADEPRRSLRMPPRRDAVTRTCSCGKLTEADCAAAWAEMKVSAQVSAVRCLQKWFLIMPPGQCPVCDHDQGRGRWDSPPSDDGPRATDHVRMHAPSTL